MVYKNSPIRYFLLRQALLTPREGRKRVREKSKKRAICSRSDTKATRRGKKRERATQVSTNGARFARAPPQASNSNGERGPPFSTACYHFTANGGVHKAQQHAQHLAEGTQPKVAQAAQAPSSSPSESARLWGTMHCECALFCGGCCWLARAPLSGAGEGNSRDNASFLL